MTETSISELARLPRIDKIDLLLSGTIVDFGGEIEGLDAAGIRTFAINAPVAISHRDIELFASLKGLEKFDLWTAGMWGWWDRFRQLRPDVYVNGKRALDR